ncbi:MAG TPA: response regulator [Bryobacteraceae bacterium]|nr:response regulator [Bryobacteraceae bacterium]
MGTILIVDDAAASSAALEEACAAVPGVSVLGVKSPLDAVRILRDSDRICAVITDIRMPRMDGFELIRLMRADRKHAATPIIVVTADTDPETPERASRLGADAFFSKPFSPAAIRRRLGELLDETQLSG